MAYRTRSGALPATSGVPATVPSSRRGRVRAAVVVMVWWIALLWAIEVVDVVTGHALDGFAVSPREVGELRDVVPSAFLHFGFAHLAANTGPLLVLGFLVALSGVRRLLAVVAVIVLVGGLGVWLTAPDHTATAGASGVVFGLLGFLVVRGFVNRRPVDLVVGLLVALVYGSLVWGLLPTASGVSWQGHLFGLAGGVLAAFALRRPRGLP